MTTPIVVPPMGESITEASVAKWLKKVGDAVRVDEALVELETDKVTLEVNAQVAGIISEIKVPQGGTVNVGAVLCLIQEGAAGAVAPVVAPEPVAVAPLPVATPALAPAVMPAARKLADDRGINTDDVAGTGKGNRVTKEDVVDFTAPRQQQSQAAGVRPRADREERAALTRLRQRIAERLKEAQNTAAMLTTFNEVDMTAIMAMRSQHKDAFEKKNGVKLGFMSFFVKACIEGLKEIPSVNAEIDGHDLVYKNYYDIGVAVGTANGLVVPVVRDADGLSFAAIEKQIGELGARARDGKLSISDLSGGTFTITNGGIYGSLMSTPILNTPQSGILGMHAIKERPVVVNGKIEIRPMMYLALSYDHRVIDGREAVTFLVRVKECLENPERLLLGV